MSLSIPYLPPVSVDGESVASYMPIVFFDDFLAGGFVKDLALSSESDPGAKFSAVADCGEWLCTIVDGGGDDGHAIACADDAVGGWLAITTDDADNDSIEMQLNGESFQLATNKKTIFEVRMKGADVSEFDWFVGLAITDTTTMTASSDRIGFECPDSTGDIDAISEKDGSQTTTDSGKDLADNTFVVLRFEADGTDTVRYYVDGSLVATHTTTIPEDEALTPTICIRNDGAAANTMTLDYILVARDR